MEAVANWLWQGTIVAAAAALLVRAPRQFGATARYRVWWAAMAIVLLLPLAPAAASALASVERDLSATADVLPAPAMQLRVARPPQWVSTAVGALWVFWMTVSAIRLAAAAIGLRRARRAARPFPAARERRLVNWTALSRQGRPATLMLSDDVRYAAVLGGRAPVIAVSPSVAAALDDPDLDRIVVHEWAHVQRRDDRDRLLQLAVRAIAGLHPAVRWLDRRIHVDRETACDDWTVNVTGSAKAYAASLTRLAAIQSSARDAILQPGALTSSDLTRRVMRLLDDTRTTSTERSQLRAACMVPVLAAAAAAAAVVNVQLIAIEREAAAVVRSALGIDPPAVAATAALEAAGKTGLAPKRNALEAGGRSTGARLAVAPPPPQDRVERRFEPQLATREDEDAVRGPHPLDVTTPSELPGTVSSLPGLPTVIPLAQPPVAESLTTWGAAADAGVQIGRGSQKAATATADAGVQVGRGSQKAAVATAGFFSKLGKSIARSF